MLDIQEQLKKLPGEPGVYLMKDENDKHEKIEAVGKRDMGVLLLSLLATKEEAV